MDLPQIIYTRTPEESKAINEDSGPGVIISASGMCDSGRIQHHLKHHLWREASHIVIIGYQAEGTVGRRIVDGAKTVRLFGEEIAIKAHIHTVGGFSAHADQKGLLEWLSHFKNPGMEIFVNHGEEKISVEFGEIIRQRFHLDATVPQWREKKVLFASEEMMRKEEVIVEKRPEETQGTGETVFSLFKELDRSYRRLRRKMRKGKAVGKALQDPQWVKQLEEIHAKVKGLGSELS